MISKQTQALTQIKFLDFLFGSSEEPQQIICADKFQFAIFKDEEHVVFDVTAAKGSWFGFGFGITMTNADMVLFEVSSEGVAKVTDLWSKGPYYPLTDFQQDYSLVYDQADLGNQIRFKTKRLADTNDIQDYVIPFDESFVINWAGCPCSSKMNYHRQNIGWMKVLVPSAGGPASIKQYDRCTCSDNECQCFYGQVN